MLVDLTLRPHHDPILAVIGGSEEIVRLQRGIYQMHHWNPEYYFVEKLTEVTTPTSRHLTSYERLLPHCDQQTLREQAFHNCMAEYRSRERKMRRLYSQRYKRNWRGDPGTYGGAYGVCDYPAQVLERYPHYGDDDTPRAITCVEIRREHQPETMGWRYHKWGRYIGRQRPRSEYLANDLHIDAVWTFTVHEVLPA